MTSINAAATVWWDMDSCPVPDDYDVCQVGPCIKFALEKLGCDGPITINAMGDLKGIPAEVLQSLASSGIFVRFFPFDIVLYMTLIKISQPHNPTPDDTQVFIMDSCRLKRIVRIMSELEGRGFRIVMVYPEERPEVRLDLLALPWKSVLKYAKRSETRFGCRICRLGFSRLEEFTQHLDIDEHAGNVDCIYNQPPKNAYHDEETSEEDEDLDEQDDPARVEEAKDLMSIKIINEKLTQDPTIQALGRSDIKFNLLSKFNLLLQKIPIVKGRRLGFDSVSEPIVSSSAMLSSSTEKKEMLDKIKNLESVNARSHKHIQHMQKIQKLLLSKFPDLETPPSPQTSDDENETQS